MPFFKSEGSQSYYVLVDGIGGHQDLSIAIKLSDCTRQTLGEFGFLLADEKCNWEPSLKIVRFGHLLDMQSYDLFITEERIKRLQIKIDSVLNQLRTNSKMLLHVKVLASVTVRKEANIRKRYNQLPHLTLDTTWESNKYTINITNKCQKVSPFQAGNHKAAMNRRKSMRNSRHKTQMIHRRRSDYFLTECFREYSQIKD